MLCGRALTPTTRTRMASQAMIELYTWTTLAGLAPIILLEELALSYDIVPVSPSSRGHRPGYRVISPNETVPALVDPDGPEGPLTVCGWGAIAIYLAEKAGRLLPPEGAARYAALEWLSFQVGTVGPTMTQAAYFVNAEHPQGSAEERFSRDAQRVYRALDARLGLVHFLAGDYSVADVGTFPCVRDPELVDLDLATYPNVARWIERVESRVAVREALAAMRPAPAEEA